MKAGTEVHVSPRALSTCPYECQNHGHVEEVKDYGVVVLFDNGERGLFDAENLESL